jgi:hypothetical protein
MSRRWRRALVAGGWALVVSGCHTVVPPPPSSTPSALEIGDRQFEAGDLGTAAASYESFLGERPGEAVAGGDRALFRLAMMALADSADGRSSGFRWLRRLVANYPASPYRASADLVLAYEAEVRRLREQLEALKAIDLDPPG